MRIVRRTMERGFEQMSATTYTHLLATVEAAAATRSAVATAAAEATAAATLLAVHGSLLGLAAWAAANRQIRPALF